MIVQVVAAEAFGEGSVALHRSHAFLHGGVIMNEAVMHVGGEVSSHTPGVRRDLDVLFQVKIQEAAAILKGSLEAHLTLVVDRHCDILPAEHFGLGIGVPGQGVG